MTRRKETHAVLVQKAECTQEKLTIRRCNCRTNRRQRSAIEDWASAAPMLGYIATIFRIVSKLVNYATKFSQLLTRFSLDSASRDGSRETTARDNIDTDELT
jgi:hypothetical protein